MSEADVNLDWLNNYLHAQGEAVLNPPALDYCLKLLLHILHIQVHAYAADGRLLFKLCNHLDDSDPLQSDPEFTRGLIAKARQERVFVTSDHGPIVYGGLQSNSHSIIFGPVVIGSPHEEIAKIHGMRHHAGTAYLTKGDMPSFCAALLLLHNVCCGERLSLNTFIARSFLNSEIIQSLKHKITSITALNIEGQPHHPLSMETRVLENIRLGDPDKLLQSLDTPYPGRRGTLAAEPLRSEKNIGIIDITLSARSAISGGLEVEKAYVVADAYILQVENAPNAPEVYAVKTAAQLQFAQMVKATRNKASDHLRLNQPPELRPPSLDSDQEEIKRQDKLVLTIKNYVQRNLSRKLTIESISHDLHLSKSYLQQIFRQREGMPLMRYCRQEKLKLAQSMLKDSDYSISEITEMLSFCSQSHFTQCFKKEIGITPDAYRLKNKVTI